MNNKIQCHQVYRTIHWLGNDRSSQERSGMKGPFKTPLAPRDMYTPSDIRSKWPGSLCTRLPFASRQHRIAQHTTLQKHVATAGSMPPAYDPCRNHQEEREYDLALRDPNRCFGRGIKEDPLVVWLNRPRSLKRDLIWKHNNFAKSIAKMLGYTHTWIIKTATNKKYVRDTDSRRRLGNTNENTEYSGTYHRPKRFISERTDMHVELRLGTDLYECRLSARAYVVLEKRGNPDRYMTKLARRFNRNGAGEHLEFQRWDKPPERVLPREPISLRPNWDTHANVGPYLDTYRPPRPNANTAYTSPDANPPTREFIENLGFVGGRMSDEMRAMVRQCHADYRVYHRLHDELVAMENPPSESLAGLQLLREHLVSMKRDIYRETKGILE